MELREAELNVENEIDRCRKALSADEYTAFLETLRDLIEAELEKL